MKIEIKDVDYIYNEGIPNEVYALKDINVEINKGEILFSNYQMEQVQEGILKPFQMNILDENN